MDDYVQQKFDRVSLTYATRYLRPKTILDGEKRRRMELVLDYAKRFQPRTVLDLGCGAGNVCAAVAQELPSSRVIGVDLSYSMLQVACGAGRQNRTFIQASAGQLPLPSNSFDLVFALGVVDYVADLSRFFDNVRDVLKPGGHLLFTCPNGDSVSRAVRGAHQRLRGTIKHTLGLSARVKAPVAVAPRSLARIDRSLRQSGFTVLERHLITYGNGFATFPWSLPVSRSMETWLRNIAFGRYLAWSGFYVAQKNAVRAAAA